MENRGPTVLTVTIILLCISTTFTALRLISRFGVVKRVSNDDYMIILAWVSVSGSKDGRIVCMYGWCKEG